MDSLLLLERENYSSDFDVSGTFFEEISLDETKYSNSHQSQVLLVSDDMIFFDNDRSYQQPELDTYSESSFEEIEVPLSESESEDGENGIETEPDEIEEEESDNLSETEDLDLICTEALGLDVNLEFEESALDLLQELKEQNEESEEELEEEEELLGECLDDESDEILVRVIEENTDLEINKPNNSKRNYNKRRASIDHTQRRNSFDLILEVNNQFEDALLNQISQLPKKQFEGLVKIIDPSYKRMDYITMKTYISQMKQAKLLELCNYLSYCENNKKSTSRKSKSTQVNKSNRKPKRLNTNSHSPTGKPRGNSIHNPQKNLSSSINQSSSNHHVKNMKKADTISAQHPTKQVSVQDVKQQGIKNVQTKDNDLTKPQKIEKEPLQQPILKLRPSGTYIHVHEDDEEIDIESL